MPLICGPGRREDRPKGGTLSETGGHLGVRHHQTVPGPVQGADPACLRWPFEHALAQLDFGEWLRRRRRAAEARPVLGTALEIFERLDARPWIERTTAELRAAGVTVADSAAPEAVADLTPQELEIAQLAAEGLTNRDIGARLYLSPRTIGFHLHKIFPKFGITGRTQLRDVLGPARLPDH